MSGTQTNAIEGAGERDLSGRKLADYELIRRLGRGGMADVYLARQSSLGRQVAVKVLKSSLAADEKYIRRFQQEARAAASLVHANIVQIHEVAFRDGVHFIAQEYVQGVNLRQYLTRHGPADAPLALRIMRQVAAALQRSAEQNIIHRDIKPENIMLASTGEVKVADFGLARAVDSEELGLTQIGITMGTPLYMSPEQVQARPVDPRSDIYSLGVTSYHMLAGRPPFEGETALSVAVQHINTEPVRLEELRKDLPPALCRVVHRMIEKRPEARYQSAAELLRDLRSIVVDSDGSETVIEEWTDAELDAMTSSRHAATQQLAKVMASQALRVQQRRRRIVVGAIAALLAFSVGAAFAWVRRPPSLLAERTEHLNVQRRDSAMAQFFRAQLEEKDPEAAYLAVEAYFDPAESAENRYWVRRSWQRLGELYLERDELDKAMAVYERLANVEETETVFKAAGYFGQAIVHSRLGEDSAALDKLAEAASYVRSLTESEIQMLLEQLKPDLRDEMEQILRGSS